MDSLIVIQKIHTAWSKNSRGGKLATERNAVPDALAIPAEKLQKPIQGMIEHSIIYSEWRGFPTPSSERFLLTRESDGKIRFGCLVIDPIGAGLKVIFEYDARYAGMPVRHASRGGEPSIYMQLQPRQWGRVLYNGRFSANNWWYEKTVVNIGLFEKPEEDLFISNQPDQVISQMAKLW